MFFGIILLLLFLDQASKIAVYLSMVQGESIPLLPPVLYLTCVYNSGAAFGLLANKTTLLIGITLILAAGFVLAYRMLPLGRVLVRYGVALIIGGTLGNLLDRVRLGYVVDFLDLRFWPVFNLADVAIVTGAGLLIWDIIISRSQPEENN